MSHVLSELSLCTDAELVCRLERLVKADRRLTAELVVHLGEVDARKLYEVRSYHSMFDYCMSALHMSEAEAYLRIQAARIGRRFPLVIEQLRVGALHLSGIKLLAPLLTEDNHVQLLERAERKSKRQIERLVAELAPKPGVPTTMRKLPKPRCSSIEPGAAASAIESFTTTSSATVPATAVLQPSSSASALLQPSSPAASLLPSAVAAASAIDASSFTLQSVPARASITPLGPDRFKLQLMLDKETHDRLEQLQDLLRHQNPSGDLARILERAVSELHERTMKQRFAQTHVPKQRASRPEKVAAPDIKPTGSSTSARARTSPTARTTSPTRKSTVPQSSAPISPIATSADSTSPIATSADSTSTVATSADSTSTAPTSADSTSTAPTSADSTSTVATHADSTNIVATSAVFGPTSTVATSADSTSIVPTSADSTSAVATDADSTSIVPTSADSTNTVATSAVVGPTGAMPARSRYIPRAVLREVYARDGGQCTFVSADGRRCSARGFLQVHHHGTTYARGGEATVDNLRLSCRGHNLLFARRDYGGQLMQEKIAQKRVARERACGS